MYLIWILLTEILVTQLWGPSREVWDPTLAIKRSPNQDSTDISRLEITLCNVNDIKSKYIMWCIHTRECHSNTNQQATSTYDPVSESHKHNVEKEKLDTKGYMMLPLICEKLKQNRQNQSLMFKSMHLEKSTSHHNCQHQHQEHKNIVMGRAAVMFLLRTKCLRYVCFLTTCWWSTFVLFNLLIVKPISQ